MADQLHKPSSSAEGSREQVRGPELREQPAPVLDKGGREAIAEALTGAEKVSERASESPSEQGGAGGQKGDDQGQQTGSQGDGEDTDLLFDEKHLPPAPQMIRRIEKQLRTQISQLEKEARKFKGGVFGRMDLHKYSETMIQIREKNVLLQRLLSMAYESLKSLYIHFFKPKDKIS